MILCLTQPIIREHLMITRTLRDMYLLNIRALMNLNFTINTENWDNNLIDACIFE